jgi:hypothetical protein
MSNHTKKTQKEKEEAAPIRVSLRTLFVSIDAVILKARSAGDAKRSERARTKTALERHMMGVTQTAEEKLNGVQRIQKCRDALSALDRRGWDRSFHQRMFHEVYLKSCVRIFFKRDGPGAFARNHNRVLELNGWDSTPQEVLVSTPRRFGKTISVSMFAAALIFAAPSMELSIYSTCKRISQKLLRNIIKFVDLIYLELGVEPYKILRMNQEEIHLAGPEGHGDVRVVNSYPSKIGMWPYNIISKKGRCTRAVALSRSRSRRITLGAVVVVVVES